MIKLTDIANTTNLNYLYDTHKDIIEMMKEQMDIAILYGKQSIKLPSNLSYLFDNDIQNKKTINYYLFEKLGLYVDFVVDKKTQEIQSMILCIDKNGYYREKYNNLETQYKQYIDDTINTFKEKCDIEVQKPSKIVVDIEYKKYFKYTADFTSYVYSKLIGFSDNDWFVDLIYKSTDLDDNLIVVQDENNLELEIVNSNNLIGAKISCLILPYIKSIEQPKIELSNLDEIVEPELSDDIKQELEYYFNSLKLKIIEKFNVIDFCTLFILLDDTSPKCLIESIANVNIVAGMWENFLNAKHKKIYTYFEKFFNDINLCINITNNKNEIFIKKLQYNEPYSYIDFVLTEYNDLNCEMVVTDIIQHCLINAKAGLYECVFDIDDFSMFNDKIHNSVVVKFIEKQLEEYFENVVTESYKIIYDSNLYHIKIKW